MLFSYTGKVEQGVIQDYVDIMIDLESSLSQSFAVGELGDFDYKISFCPLILSAQSLTIFSEKSKNSRKDRTYYYTPQISFEQFTAASRTDRRRILLGMLSKLSGSLRKLGATTAQQKHFKDIIANLA